jgi:hypothetical protein
MRYVSNIPPATSRSETRQVKGLTGIYVVKAVHMQDKVTPYAAQHAYAEGQHHPVVEQQKLILRAEDRRKICRRVSHLPVLEELRSGVDRRHHHLRDGDEVEHIDETA